MWNGTNYYNCKFFIDSFLCGMTPINSIPMRAWEAKVNKEIKNGISAGPKVVSKIPYTLQMVDHFCLNWKILPSSNDCKLIYHGHRFVKLRKYLCFCLFMQQRKIFCSTERIFSPEQLQIAPKKDVNLRPFTRKTFCEYPKVCVISLYFSHQLNHNTL